LLSCHAIAGVGTQGVPWRVADHRIEARTQVAMAVRTVKHLGELELPVEEPLHSRDERGVVDDRAAIAVGKRTSAVQY
jgi:hypothetical protein